MAKLEPEVLSRAAILQASEECSSYHEAANRLGIAESYIEASIRSRQRPWLVAGLWVLGSAAWLQVGLASSNLELIWWTLMSIALAPLLAAKMPFSPTSRTLLLGSLAACAATLVQARFDMGSGFGFTWAVGGILLPLGLMWLYSARPWKESFR